MTRATERARRHGVALKWGKTGPFLLTTLIRELGIEELSWETSEVYPWNWPDALAVFDRAQTSRLEALTRSCTFAHFFNEVFRRYDIDKTIRPPEGTFLDLLYDAYDVPISSERRYTEAEISVKLAIGRRRYASLTSALAKVWAIRRWGESGSRA